MHVDPKLVREWLAALANRLENAELPDEPINVSVLAQEVSRAVVTMLTDRIVELPTQIYAARAVVLGVTGEAGEALADLALPKEMATNCIRQNATVQYTVPNGEGLFRN